MTKFTSYLECLNEICRLENIREHYHCHDYPCFGKILSKKEEVIRHVKWHRKRMESWTHGFMRFSSSDDCSTTFGSNCQHNRRQTHYHCFQPKCDRVYISTSDVQMHSNYHRKDSAIHKEGFQRFRANEKCNAYYCMFADQKTTHFHCRRNNCQYTFKNKADMEKHKTYHIKDLKLAQDGFRKVLKNESCPYKQCRFSKVCNHIHCARENCFYVLHSSGQLLSHKRKHEKKDNEQSYCQYKMLAVKAALLENPKDEVSSRIGSFNVSNSSMELRYAEMRAFNPKPWLASSKQEPASQNMYKALSPSSTALSVEFFQQMKNGHEDLSIQKHHQPELPSDINDGPEVSMITVGKSANIAQHQSNISREPPHLTASVIQQFFMTECPSQDKDELFDIKPSREKTSQKDCSWKESQESHLHCILKGCEAVIPNKFLDISEHIQKHGYNRDFNATIAAPEALLDSPSTSYSSNPLQMTTIDGFFNRKRGRPPKNRFVEVYKNKSPQAIFTSFKLEKQTTNKNSSTEKCDAPNDSTGHQLCIHTTLPNHEEEFSTIKLSLSSPQHEFSQQANSEFVVYKVNESCGVAGLRCPLNMQHHYHCTCAPDCIFVTVEQDLLGMHLQRKHTATSFADIISKKFKRFDRLIGLDCGIIKCRLRKKRPHLHCRQCFHQISPFDFESHVCEAPKQRICTSYPTKKISSSSTYIHEFPRNLQSLLEEFPEGQNFIKSYSTLPSVTFSDHNELRKKVSEMETESSSKHGRGDEKVLVVRAAGTYFPENTIDSSNIHLPARPQTTEIQQTPAIISSNSVNRSTPICRQMLRLPDHCEAFMGPVKWRAQRLKSLQVTKEPIPFPLHFLKPEDSKPVINTSPLLFNENNHQKKISIGFDEQPQDLCLSPGTTNTPLSEKNTKLKQETFPYSSTAKATLPQFTPTSGHFTNLFSHDMMSSVWMRNFHLAQLATLYQQNPYNFQHHYPSQSKTTALNTHLQTTQPNCIPGKEDKPHIEKPTKSINSQQPSSIPSLQPAVNSFKRFPYESSFLMTSQSLEHASPSHSISSGSTGGPPSLPGLSCSTWEASRSCKRKLTDGKEDFSALIDPLSPSKKKQMQFAAGLAAVAAVAAADSNATSTKSQSGAMSANVSGQTMRVQHGQHFKVNNEQIPNGYLKFRFNEDCFFPKCGYRNHQSHFHCDRNDCHYSFCDKTRFVQHTARHERLDKLMGNDFRQYRANMSCGYESCPYYKNLGSANKSSHFHCLKCDFICSDTNKVVAHRRQHSKMEFIQMAGFRKVINTEQCNSTFEATVSTNDNDIPGTVECSYSQKQTHYHCLMCDVSVLSKAQLSSHKHKT